MIHIDRLQVVTHRPLGERQARALGDWFARALATALRRDGSADARVRIDHMRLELPDDAMHGRGVMRDAVHSVARGILERSHDSP